MDSEGELVGFRNHRVSNEGRAGFALRVSEDLKGQGGEQFLLGVLDALQPLWAQGEADREALVALLRSLTEHGLRREADFVAAKRCLSSKMDVIDDFRAIIRFAEAYPEELEPSDFDRARSEFLLFAPEYADGWGDDPDLLRQIASDLDFVGDGLQVDVTHLTEPLSERASEIEAERADMEREPDDEERWESSPAYGDSINDMFEGLREELEG
jgi:hypothetical protein